MGQKISHYDIRACTLKTLVML